MKIQLYTTLKKRYKERKIHWNENFCCFTYFDFLTSFIFSYF